MFLGLDSYCTFDIFEYPSGKSALCCSASFFVRLTTIWNLKSYKRIDISWFHIIICLISALIIFVTKQSL